MKTTYILFGCLFFSACNNKAPEPEQATEIASETQVALTDNQLQNTIIEIGKIEQKNISSVIRLNGKIDVPPQNLVSVSVPMGGYLRSTKLLPGMHINKGEIIATIEDQQYIQLQQDYLLAKSKLYFTTLEYNRQKELNESQASSDKITQQAQAEMNNQHITMNALAQKLTLININPAKLTANTISKKIYIYSTIKGFVSKVNMNVGKYANPTDVLFELVNPSDIHLNIKVFEKDVASLSIGQKLIAYSNTQPDKKYKCEIILISKDVSADGTTETHCHFETYDKTLLPGMYMNAEIEIANKNTNALPEESIVNFEGKEYIFEAKSKKEFDMLEVKTGNKEKGFTEILNAENYQNKPIVTKGAYTLLMKLKNKEE